MRLHVADEDVPIFTFSPPVIVPAAMSEGVTFVFSAPIKVPGNEVREAEPIESGFEEEEEGEEEPLDLSVKVQSDDAHFLGGGGGDNDVELEEGEIPEAAASPEPLVRVRPMEQLLERNVRVDDGFKLNISEEACDERVSQLLTDIRETLDKRLRSERGVDDDDDDVVIVGEEWNVDPLGDAGPAEERPKDLDNAPPLSMGPGPRVKVLSSGKALGKVVKPAKPKKVKSSMKPQVSPTIGSLGYSNPLGTMMHNGAFRVKCTLVHHLGCERTFAKVEHMKWHLKSGRDHKRFPCFSCESTLAFHTVEALAEHVLCTPHDDDELNMLRHGRKYKRAKKRRLDAIQQQQIGLNNIP